MEILRDNEHAVELVFACYLDCVFGAGKCCVAVTVHDYLLGGNSVRYEVIFHHRRFIISLLANTSADNDKGELARAVKLQRSIKAGSEP